MVEILRNEGNLVGVKLTGKLHDVDYKEFVPVVEAAAEKGKLHLLVQMTDFQGWDRAAMWDDIHFGRDIADKTERLAFIGDKRWEEWMTKLCKPFVHAQIAYFDASQEKDAWAWVQDGLTDAED